MPGVPLITVGGPEAAAREEGEVTGVPGDEAGTAEDTTAPTTEEGHAEGAPEPAAEVERTEAAEGTPPPRLLPPKPLLLPKRSLHPHKARSSRPLSPSRKTLQRMLQRRHTPRA
jgi:hypothetical protein